MHGDLSRRQFGQASAALAAGCVAASATRGDEPAKAGLHRLDPERIVFAAQSEDAIAAGAFHNDVVAVANERVLFAHEKAFADKSPLIASCEQLVPGFEYVEVPDAEVPLADAIRSYLFNAQLVTQPSGETALVDSSSPYSPPLLTTVPTAAGL